MNIAPYEHLGLKVYIKREIKGLRFGWKLNYKGKDYSQIGYGGESICQERLNKKMKLVDPDWVDII